MMLSTLSDTVPRFSEFHAFVRKRHQIYLDRKAGKPGPWTDDPVLAGGRFCNIFRELDTVTIWIDQHIRKPYAHHENLWLMLAIARYINWPPTLQALFDTASMPTFHQWRPEHMTRVLEELARDKEKIYTGAYMIRAESDPRKEWYAWSKHRYIAEIVIGRLWEDRDGWTNLLTQAEKGNAGLSYVWDRFQKPRYVGWGPFMAYEVVTDLRHTRYLCNAPDIYTWANAGPGAIRGLNRIHGRPLDYQPKSAVTNGEMNDLMTWMNAKPNPWTGQMPRWAEPWFEMRDIEHSCCEFDKHQRVLLGEGKMRSKYDWTKATDLTK